MDREALDRLSREELLELVHRQREELAEREAAIERRDEKIRDLEAELAQFRGPVKTPENSSVPPSRAAGEPARGSGAEARPEAGARRGQPTAQRTGCGGALSPGDLRWVRRAAPADWGPAGGA